MTNVVFQLTYKLCITSLLLNTVVVEEVKVCSWRCIFLFFCFAFPWSWYFIDRFILKSKIEEKRSQLDKANYKAKGQYKKYCFRVLAGVSNKQYTIVTSRAWKMLFTIIMTHNKNLGSSHITCALTGRIFEQVRKHLSLSKQTTPPWKSFLVFFSKVSLAYFGQIL